MPNRYEVGLGGLDATTVVLTINGTPLPMTYDTANRLAVALRGYGKMAKRNAGDLSVRTIGFANLTDAVRDEYELQKRRDGTAAFFKAP